MSKTIFVNASDPNRINYDLDEKTSWKNTPRLVSLKKGDTKTPTTAEKIEEAMRHVLLIQRYKGERAAVIESRKHLVQYIKGMPNAASLREKLNSMHTVEEVILALQCLIAAG